MSLRLKAVLITAVLSAGLFLAGFSIGKYWLAHEMEDIKILTAQATDRVLLLTKQNQLLQEKLEQLHQQPPLAQEITGRAWIWPDGQGYRGLLESGQSLLLSPELNLKLLRIDPGANLAVFRLYANDNSTELKLIPGAVLPISHAWQLGLRYLQPGWAVVILEPR
ncbi:MAG: hypothetical protein LBJ14_04395 [Desulfarculales bacterium]|jgi:hypothetical protein|nr:hypothetical protein [Desulfarculales bacterium]